MEMQYNPYHSERLRCMMAQEVKRKCAERFLQAMQQTLGNTLGHFHHQHWQAGEKNQTRFLLMYRNDSDSYRQDGNIERRLRLPHWPLEPINFFYGCIYIPRTKLALHYATCGKQIEVTHGVWLLSNGPYRQKPKPWHHRNLATHDHILRSHPCLTTKKYARNSNGPTARFEHSSRTLSKKVEQISIGTHLPALIGTSIIFLWNVYHFFQACPSNQI